MIDIHAGVVWCYRISGGWYKYIKPFPEAMKKVKGKTKDEYVPDVNHPSVLKWEKDHV